MTQNTDGGNGVFPVAGKGQLGYVPAQVDAFLERARATFEGSASDADKLTGAELRRVAFGTQKKGGYSPRFVDAALDRLEEVLFERERAEIIETKGEEAWWDECRSLLSDIRGRLARPRGKRFKRRGIFATGYSVSEVDALMDRVRDMFEDKQLTLSPAEVRSAVFHGQWRGYDEEQVDALLDGVLFLVLATKQ